MFKYIQDPGHGWVKVPIKELVKLGLTEHDFTPYSPYTLHTMYLEEDVDAPKFLAAYEAKYGRKAELKEVLVNKRPRWAR